MESIDIFTMALGLQAPWTVTKAEFTGTDESARELHITIGFKKGHKFQAAGAEAQTAYDTVERTWRHLDFFQHKCYIHASVPRIRIDEHHISMVEVPWVRPQSGFTLLFEVYQMLLIEGEMPVSKVSETVKETSPRIWRVFGYWVERALGKGKDSLTIENFAEYLESHGGRVENINLNSANAVFIN